MVTYLFVIGFQYFEQFKNVKFRQWQKKLLSLRSNPQTGSSYIQNCNSLYTRTDYHMLLPIVLQMAVPLLYKNSDKLIIVGLSFVLLKDRWVFIDNVTTPRRNLGYNKDLRAS